MKNSTKIIRKNYVFVHEIKINNYDIIKQIEIIEKILNQNKSLHENLQIIKIAWSINAIKNKKFYFSLIIEINISTMINRFVKKN